MEGYINTFTNVMQIKITGTGSAHPSQEQSNEAFLEHNFYDLTGSPIATSNEEIISKFKAITGIEKRRYISSEKSSADIAVEAGQKALEDAQINPESLDYIIVAHNVGDIASDSHQVNTLPCVAAKVKAGLEIVNPNCVAYDLIFGCPGWIEGLIQAQAFLKAGMAKKCLVIGTETLSRVLDPNDRDSMIYADGAGAAVVEQCSASGGILGHKTVTYTHQGESDYIYYGTSNKAGGKTQYIKMFGRKVYEFALSHVPDAIAQTLKEASISIADVKKIFIHQANEKMDEAIVKRLYRIFKEKMPNDVLPMNIATYGNSSVATVPTLFDLVRKENYMGHQVSSGDIVVFASVGAGMNINAVVYQI
tara:strand:- start:818 stop:1906 length:1089 start_codon:yes stop_codon:yes gene_type:complete